jgi:hypothetical protein
MENEGSKNRTIDIAFLVDSENLQSLEKLLSEIKGERDYKVKFSDGSTIKYSEVDDVLGQPNSDKRFIVSLLASVEGNTGQSAFVSMRNDPEPSVEYTINGPQRNVIYFADKLDDWIASSKQWYSVFYSSRLVLLPVIGAFILPFYLSDKAETLFPAQKSWIGLTTIVAVIAAEIGFFKLFPRGTFTIGYGTKRHQMFNYVRSGLIVTFVLSIIAGLITNWLSGHLYGYGH